MLKFGQFALVLMFFIGIAACDKQNTGEAFSVIGDVRIIKRMDGDQDLYARSYYAFGNYPMASAKVYLPEGGTINLSSNDTLMRVFSKVPTINDFKPEAPTSDQYEFVVINEDIEHTVNEELVQNNLPYATITKAQYENGGIRVEWESVDAASNYKVKLLSEDLGTTLFSSIYLPAGISVFQIKDNLSVVPETGVNYIVEVHAFEYDAGTDLNSGDKEYNINEVSIATQSVVWGE